MLPYDKLKRGFTNKTELSGGSRPSPKGVGGGGGAFEGLTMNVEFCENNQRSKKVRYFRKNEGGGGLAPPLNPPLEPHNLSLAGVYRS